MFHITSACGNIDSHSHDVYINELNLSA